ncbi:unnamed protein product [Effrenium voratum]|nr:unnamed protein product [Effrenium voratum]
MHAPLRLAFIACLAAATRPCSRRDVHYDLSECHTSRGGKVREAFAYAGPGCNLSAPNSLTLPKPLLDLPCEQPCEAGKYLRLKEDVSKGQLALQCLRCPAGRFSLGGGQYLDGSVGDWGKPWPAGLTTSCLYRGSDSQWSLGGGARLACLLHVHTTGPEELRLETRASTWNQDLPEQDLEAPLAITSSLACAPLNASLRNSAVLVLRGTCAFSVKAKHLADAGAKAVVVYNNLYNSPYFYPAAAPNTTKPVIPMFMVTREDGERIIAAEGTLTLHVPSTRCSLDTREVAPNRSEGNASSPADSWEAASDKGCAHWTADPSGGFLHSGDNRGFHWLFSFLTFSARFVRDGYLRFRYGVDAEQGYDGLIFEMDGQAIWNKTISQAPPWREFRLEVPRGAHSFTWTFKKDFSTSSGEDRARLQLLELSGSGHGDLSCRSCSVLSSPGSTRCQGCGRDSFAEVLPSGRVSCQLCPNGTWAPPSSMGPEACQARRECTAQDAVVVYRAENGQVACSGNTTSANVVWRQPQTCISQRTAQQVAGLGKKVTCPPCQPYMWRPSGSRCANRPARPCAAPKYAMPISLVKYWHLWPRNFTSWIWGEVKEEEQPHAWQLAPDGQATVVGSAFLGEEVQARADQALLTYDVTLVSSGELTFVLEERPVGAWSSAGALYVDHAPRVPQVVSRNGLLHCTLWLDAGWHWITWVWRYSGLEEQAADGIDGQAAGGSGLRLLNVSVTNVQGAPRGPCQLCPDGHGLDAARSCRRCGAGEQSVGGRCQPCPNGTASSSPGARCEKCGPGTFAAGSACRPLPSLGGRGQQKFDTLRIGSVWHNATQETGLKLIQVEDKSYYVNLAESHRLPGGIAGAAYIWEVLPPREACAAERSAESAFARPLAERLEAVKRNEGRPPGLWFTFVGNCTEVSGQRRTHVLLSCADAAPWDFRLLSGMRPAMAGGQSCEDLALEWRTPLACPLCQEPRDGAVKDIVALVLFGGLVGCILCCLSVYVLLLRRRYAKYIMLGEPDNPVTAACGVQSGFDSGNARHALLSMVF